MARQSIFSKRIGKFVFDRRILLAMMAIAAALGAKNWFEDHPQHNPWAPLDLRDPPGWATDHKLQSLRGDMALCRAVLDRSEVQYTALAAQGQGACARPDRTVLDGAPLRSSNPPMTCPLAAGFQLWLDQSVQPAAVEHLGSKVAEIQHLGVYSCRRMYGGDSGPWSEHATGNAIDIAGFTLEDGQIVSLLGDWEAGDSKAAFLRQVRDDACSIFGTVLSPDYNAQHRDHFHFDQAPRRWGVCR